MSRQNSSYFYIYVNPYDFLKYINIHPQTPNSTFVLDHLCGYATTRTVDIHIQPPLN